MKQELKALWQITKFLLQTTAYTWLFWSIMDWYWSL